jgi:predicted nucleic acid-binding protein
MKIVLDTNIIFSDYHLTGAKIRNLCESVKSTGDFVFIPQVVIDEATNQYKKNLQGYKLKIDAVISDYKRLTNTKVENTLISDKTVTEEFENYLKISNEQIEKSGIKIIPYPCVLHKELVKRDLACKKPFTIEGKGYRDALIWESIKSICEEPFDTLAIPEIIFISKNKKDFCEKNYSLHSDLKEDLDNSNINECAIKVVEDIDKFIAEYIKLKQKIKTDIIDKLNKDKKYNEIDLNIEIENRLEKFLLHREFDYENNPFRQEFENPSIVGINESAFEVKDVRQLSDKETLIEIDVDVECEFDFFIFKSDFYVMDEDELPHSWDNDWNKHYMAASESKTISLKISFIVDNTFKELLSDDIEFKLKYDN